MRTNTWSTWRSLCLSFVAGGEDCGIIFALNITRESRERSVAALLTAGGGGRPFYFCSCPNPNRNLIRKGAPVPSQTEPCHDETKRLQHRHSRKNTVKFHYHRFSKGLLSFKNPDGIFSICFNEAYSFKEPYYIMLSWRALEPFFPILNFFQVGREP